jgi:predicted PurR-regulated permease PerM
MRETAQRTAVAALVAVSVVVVALALWKLKLVISLFFLALIVAAAMRPGVEALKRRGIPRGIGVGLNYVALAGFVTLALWLVVPRALDQVQQAVGTIPTTRAELNRAANHSTGIKHEILVDVQQRLKGLPSAGELVRPAAEITVRAFEVLLAIFFVFASAAYWIFERERAIDLVTSLLPRPRRKLVRDTWDLIDLKLGAFVRGQGLLIVIVGTVLSLLFLAIGEPYWILIGSFAGLVEVVPVIGPLTAGALAIGVGLGDSVRTAVAAGACVLGVRLVEDYLLIPRVLGDAVGLSPLLVLFSVSAVTILFGGFAVLLAIPLAAVAGTLVEVIVLNKNPVEEDVPTVLFPAKDAEA